MLICLYEDRLPALVGVKLAVLSLTEFAPGLRVEVTCPAAPAAFVAWLSQFPDISLSQEPVTQRGWNVKPELLLRHLRRGEPDVLWVDSDMVLAGQAGLAAVRAPADVVVATEEPYWGKSQGGFERTESWGLAPGRALSATVNTSLLRVTEQHVDLLEEWRRLLRSDAYRAAQARPWNERPLHMVGDQDVLTALLASADFAQLDVRLLRRDVDVAHCFGPAGYAPSERLRTLLPGRALPPWVHSMGSRPWEPLPEGGALGDRVRGYVERVHRDVSPYSQVVRRHRAQLGEPADWMEPGTRTGQLLTALAGGRPALPELPLALVESSARHAASRLQRTRRRLRVAG